MHIGKRWIISEGGWHYIQFRKLLKESRLASISIKTKQIKGLDEQEENILTTHCEYQSSIKDVQGCKCKASRTSANSRSVLLRQLQVFSQQLCNFCHYYLWLSTTWMGNYQMKIISFLQAAHTDALKLLCFSFVAFSQIFQVAEILH